MYRQQIAYPPPINVLLDHFLYGAIMKKAVLNIEAQIFVLTCLHFSGEHIYISTPKREIASSYSKSLSEFSTVYCDPHSQRLWDSQ